MDVGKKLAVKSESPSTIHGRLMESIHISGYSFARAAGDLEHLLEEDRWKDCGNGFEDIREFLGTVDLSPFNIEASRRKKLAKRMAELEASQRATASALGVSEATVNRDLNENVTSVTPSSEIVADATEGNAENVTSVTPDSGVDAALSLEKKSHVSNNSGEQEWYTPVEYIEAARKVMGSIDLDPASNVAANEIIQAGTFFTAEDDGLSQEWAGNVWMNPPYKNSINQEFCEKLAQGVESKSVTQACVLVNNATETKWFQRLASVASAGCFHSGRIQFWYPGRDSFTPLQGQAILYCGGRVSAFKKTFGQFGFVVVPK